MRFSPLPEKHRPKRGSARESSGTEPEEAAGADVSESAASKHSGHLDPPMVAEGAEAADRNAGSASGVSAADPRDLGEAQIKRGQFPAATRTRVLFVCYGNACRSQMAEGFAKAYHADVIDAESAGIAPLGFVPEETAASMLERDVSLRGHSSKGIDGFDLRSFDVVVNMSGFPFPNSLSRVVEVAEWRVDDPYLGNERRYRKVRDDIEKRVAKLAGDLRLKNPA